MDLPALVSLAIAALGLGGVIFTALRFRRDDTTAIVTQQDYILNEMRGLNEELRQTTNRLREERDELAIQVAKLREALDEFSR